MGMMLYGVLALVAVVSIPVLLRMLVRVTLFSFVAYLIGLLIYETLYSEQHGKTTRRHLKK